MKSHRFQFAYRAKASKLHRAVGDALRSLSGPFASHRTYQEYPVNKISPSFFSGAYKFDWVDLDLRCVIECHGAQHFKPVDFGGRGAKQAAENFAFIQASDASKKDAALREGFTYFFVSYDELKLITPQYLYNKYLSHYNDLPIQKTSQKPNSEYKERMKERAREYRKQQYRKLKELKGRLKDEAQNDRHTEDDTKA